MKACFRLSYSRPGAGCAQTHNRFLNTAQGVNNPSYHRHFVPLLYLRSSPALPGRRRRYLPALRPAGYKRLPHENPR